MPLNAEQMKARKGKITGTDVRTLMLGSPEQIHNLYLQRIGEKEPDNLDHIWIVQMGIALEEPNRRWYEYRSMRPLVRAGEVVTCPSLPWAAVTLDGYDEQVPCPFEAKFAVGFEPMDIVINKHQPQCQWQMLCCQTQSCALSVALAANDPVVTYIDRVQGYIDTMIDRADYFLKCCALRDPPVQLEKVPPPINPTQIYSMTGNNEWADYAGKFLVNRVAWESYEEAKTALKAMVPDDAKVCFGHGVRVTRDRANRIHIREDKLDEH
jgi:hypothetical protein